MKLTHLVKGTFLVLCLCTIYLLNTAQYDNPSNGKTGAPGEGTCSECHVPPNNTINAEMEITGIPNQVFTGTKYRIDIKVRATNGNPFNAGIQMVALDGNNQNAGELKNPRGISGVIQAGDRIYFEHKGGPTKFNNNEATWSVDWVAPDSFTNSTVSWYIATLIGDGDSTATGDRQILTNVVSTLVEGNAPLQAEVLSQNISCGGANDGSIQLDITGGVLPYSYLWSTGDTTSRIENLVPGTYNVTVSDADTSSISKSAMISESEMLEISIINTTSLGCSGQSDAMATLAVNGGIPPYTISWPDGDTSLTKNNLGVGEYEVTVFDDVGCSDTVSVNITANINIQTNLVGIHESEPRANDGFAFITPTGGTPPYLVSWNTGAFGDTITNLSPGTYFVIVGDGSGCLISDTVVILEGTCDFEIATEQTDINCNGEQTGSAQVNPANPGSVQSIIWSNGDSTENISEQPAGLYTVQVVDTVGCIGIDTIELIEPDALQLELQSLSSASCSQLGSAVISVKGGTEPYSINWSNGMNNDTIGELEAGVYSVIVIDQNQCTGSLDVTITNIDNTPPVLRRGEITLFVGSDGTVNLYDIPIDSVLFDACGIDSVWYSVAEFNCASEATAVAVQAWDDDRNMLNAAFLVNVLDTIPPIAVTPDPVMISGCDTVFYTTPQFEDNCGLDTIMVLSGQSSGTVFPDGINEVLFQAIDQSGNASIASLIIDVDVQLQYIITKDEPPCASDSTGSIIILSDNDKNYSFQWNTGLINDTLQDIPAGDYSVTITDTTGCAAVEEVILEPGGFFEIRIDTIIPADGEMMGSASVTIIGGQLPLDFVWLQGNTQFSEEEDLVAAPNGTYTLLVTDASGCTLSKTLSLGNTTSQTTLDELGIKIYPNPLKDHLTIESLQSIQEIQIRDIHGRITSQRINNPRSIDVSNLSRGLYVLRLKIDGKLFFTKVIKH